eukprot:scaffold259_cov252-Pinguiococcus_pyrenoidosus.AAC.38
MYEMPSSACVPIASNIQSKGSASGAKREAVLAGKLEVAVPAAPRKDGDTFPELHDAVLLVLQLFVHAKEEALAGSVVLGILLFHLKLPRPRRKAAKDLPIGRVHHKQRVLIHLDSPCQRAEGRTVTSHAVQQLPVVHPHESGKTAAHVQHNLLGHDPLDDLRVSIFVFFLRHRVHDQPQGALAKLRAVGRASSEAPRLESKELVRPLGSHGGRDLLHHFHHLFALRRREVSLPSCICRVIAADLPSGIRRCGGTTGGRRLLFRCGHPCCTGFSPAPLHH